MVKIKKSTLYNLILVLFFLLINTLGICNKGPKIKCTNLYFSTGYLLINEKYSDKTNSLKTGLNEQIPIGVGFTFSKLHKLEHSINFNYRTLMFSDFIWINNPIFNLISDRHGPYRSINTNYKISKKLFVDSKLRSLNLLAGVEFLLIPEKLGNANDPNLEYDNYGGAYFWQNNNLIFSMQDSSKITSPVGINLLLGFEIQNKSDKKFFCSFQPVYSIGLIKIHETFAKFNDIINSKSGDGYISTKGGYLGIVFKFGIRTIKT